MKTTAEINAQLDSLIRLWRQEIIRRRQSKKGYGIVPWEWARFVCQLELLQQWLNEEPTNIVPLPKETHHHHRLKYENH